MNVKETVRQFVSENFYVGDPAMLTDDASLLQAGIVDSTGILEVISFLESTFGIQVDDAEMVPENLDTLAGIAGFVTRKRGDL